MSSDKKLEKFCNFLDNSLEKLNKVTNKTSKDLEYEREVCIVHLIRTALRLKNKYESIGEFEKILEIYNDKLDTSIKLFIQYNIGQKYFKLKQYKKCIVYYKELYPKYILWFKRTHKSSLNIEKTIIDCHSILQDFNLVLEMTKEFIPRYEKSLINDDTYIEKIWNIELNRIDSYVQTGDKQKGIDKILEIQKLLMKKNDPIYNKKIEICKNFILTIKKYY